MNKTINSKPIRKKTNDRITIDSLKYYVPLFHSGDQAEELLLENNWSPGERNSLENRARLKPLVIKKIAALSGPLITRELNKLISNSHLNGREDLFDLLYYAGLNGMSKGLRHFDVNKMNKSSTNYLFQWIVTYAKKELSALEAPFGIAPSRFQRYKKISAVRKKLSSEINRYATNEEVLEYFHSGKADLKTMNGPVKKSNEPSQANLNMTLDIIAEQEHFEKNLSGVNLLDPLEDYSSEIILSERDNDLFSQTLFGVFLEKIMFTKVAKAVLTSELQGNNVNDDIQNELAELSDSEYRVLSNRWKELLKDKKGPFYSFLLTVKDDEFDQFNVGETITNIENHGKEIGIEKYKVLFEDEVLKYVEH